MIDHNVVRLDITMHNSLAVAEVQGLEKLENVESHIEVVELGVETAEVCVVDVLEDEGRRFALWLRYLVSILVSYRLFFHCLWAHMSLIPGYL